MFAVHSFVVEFGGPRMVIDTGVGNAKARDNPTSTNLHTDYPRRLAAAGADPETVATKCGRRAARPDNPCYGFPFRTNSTPCTGPSIPSRQAVDRAPLAGLPPDA